MINKMKAKANRGVGRFKNHIRSSDGDPEPGVTATSGTNSPVPGLTIPQTDTNLSATSSLRSTSRLPSHKALPVLNPESTTQPSTTGLIEGFIGPAPLTSDENQETHSSRHSMPVETLAPLPITHSNSTLSTWTGLKSLALVLKSGTNVVGPLRAAVDVISEFVATFESEAASRQEYEGLKIELDSLCQDLAGSYGTSVPPTMSLSIQSLSKGIEREVKIVQQKKQRSKLERYAEAVGDADTVSECYRRIHLLLSRIALNANMNSWRIADEQATKSRLKDLPYSPDARFRSAKSTSLYRGGCTPQTRVAVQEQLRIWAHDEKSEKIFWLNGMAGTGKTTIAYSLCEHLDRTLTLAGSFFCSRQLPECRDVNRIFPSITYQLALFSPPFRHALSQVLEQDPEAHNQPLVDQLSALVLDPLREIEGTLPGDLVVVIDALDECEDVQGVDLILGALLSNTSKLPIKFLVTSRPEPQIYDRMKNRQGNRTRFELYLHELDRSVVKEDIRTYLETKLQPTGLDAAQLGRLCEQSGVLFIYAATAVRYISADNFSRSAARLDLILNAPASRTQLATRDIDTLYGLILKAAFADREESEHSEMERVLWAVICAQEPLTVDIIAGLLGLESTALVRTALRPLLSVLNISKAEEVVTTLHESFPDFMLDKTSSGVFHRDEQERHGMLAQRCFDLIRTPTHPFNICNFESSYILDKAVPDLETRAKSAISAELFYACRYWVAHVIMGNQSTGLLEGLYEFLNERLMLWMEIMNLKESLVVGSGVLSQLGTWSETSQCLKGAQNLIKDAWKFLMATRGSPAVESTPHIYISMLTFWPEDRPISMTYRSRLRDLPKTSGMGLGTRKQAPVLTWQSEKPVSCAIYSPCGTYVASVATDNNLRRDCAIQIWDTRTSEMIGKPLEGHTDEVCSISYSLDGTRIVSGSDDRTIRIWNADTGEMIGKPIEGHTSSVLSVGYSPDGTRIVSGSRDRTIRIWDANTGDIIGKPIEGHTDSVDSVCFSHDGTSIASGSSDYTIRIWDTDTGEMIGKPIEGHTSSVSSVCYSPDGTRIVSGSYDRTIRIWDAGTGEMIGKPIEGHASLVLSVGYSPGGTRIVSGSLDHTIRIWDADTGEIIGKPIEDHTHAVNSVGYSPDGTRIVSGSNDRTIRIWDADTSEIIGKPIEGHTDTVYSVCYSPDGTRLVSGSLDRTIRIWDADTGEIIGKPIEGHTSTVFSVGYSPDSTRIASGSSDDTIRMWDADTAEMIGRPIEGHAALFYSVSYSPDGTRIVSGSGDYAIRIWDAVTGEIIGKPMEGHATLVVSVDYSPDGTRIVSGSCDRTIRIWDADTGEIIGKPIEGHKDSVNSVCYSPDGTRIVSGSDDHTIRIWDAHTGQIIGKPLEGHTDSVKSVCYSPDGTRIVSGSYDCTIRIWDADTGQMLGKPIEGHTSSVHSVGYSPDGTRIVSGSRDRTIRIWHASTGDILDRPLQIHTDSVDPVGYTSDSTRLVSGSAKQAIRSCDVCIERVSLSSPGETPTTIVQSIPTVSSSVSPLCPPLADTMPSPPYSNDPHANWSLNDDGWVVTEDSKLLLWVPPELRTHLMRPRNTRVISSHGFVSVDFSNAAIGESWRSCYRL